MIDIVSHINALRLILVGAVVVLVLRILGFAGPMKKIYNFLIFFLEECFVIKRQNVAALS